MANFREHLTVGTVVGGLAATSLLVAGQADPQAVFLYLSAAIIGSVLPDIDADNSTPLHIAFSFFAILLAFFTLFSQATKFSVIELLLLWLIVFLFFKLVVFALFIRTTVHRGVFHSIPAGILFGFLTTILTSQLFQLANKTAWLAGLFVFLGFIVQLLIDELFSLSLFGRGGVKHSLGSAFKLYSRDWRATGILYIATIGLFFLTPNLDNTFQETFSAQTLQTIQERFLPNSGWFGTGISMGL